jgi:hypothetical protein
MHHEEIEPNFDASCQQILGLESEILWEAGSTPTLATPTSPLCCSSGREDKYEGVSLTFKTRFCLELGL